MNIFPYHYISHLYSDTIELFADVKYYEYENGRVYLVDDGLRFLKTKSDIFALAVGSHVGQFVFMNLSADGRVEWDSAFEMVCPSEQPTRRNIRYTYFELGDIGGSDASFFFMCLVFVEL